MKKILVTVVLAMFSGIFVCAQNKSGVYLTQMDFENKKLTYATDDPSEVNKIRFNEIFNKPYLNIKHNGEKIRLFKDEIFAYQRKGKVVRTCNFVPYTFVEKGAIWIFSKDLNVSAGKGVKMDRKYYYSISGKDKIIPLTINNLKRSFPNEALLHQLIGANFRSDAELSSYDGFNNKLRVNSLLQTTIFEAGTASP